jgi:hypothetical protein
MGKYKTDLIQDASLRGDSLFPLFLGGMGPLVEGVESNGALSNTILQILHLFLTGHTNWIGC